MLLKSKHRQTLDTQKTSILDTQKLTSKFNKALIFKLPDNPESAPNKN